jgi:hypothetical protein
VLALEADLAAKDKEVKALKGELTAQAKAAAPATTPGAPAAPPASPMRATLPVRGVSRGWRWRGRLPAARQLAPLTPARPPALAPSRTQPGGSQRLKALGLKMEALELSLQQEQDKVGRGLGGYST